MCQDPLDSEFVSVYELDLYDIPEQGIENSDGPEESDFFLEQTEVSNNIYRQSSPFKNGGSGQSDHDFDDDRYNK